MAASKIFLLEISVVLVNLLHSNCVLKSVMQGWAKVFDHGPLSASLEP